MKYQLCLENGEIFEGKIKGFLPQTPIKGEIVFNTSMSGYQEVFSDPSYCDQIVTMTYPLIGNYGTHKDDYESLSPSLKAIVVKELCETPSHFRNEITLEQFLTQHKITAFTGVDTRKLTKIIRSHGTMKAVISNEGYCDFDISRDQISKVSVKTMSHFPGTGGPRVVMIDFGYKKSILTSLLKRGCEVIITPFNTSFEQVKTLRPDGILLSNGPGDPTDVAESVEVIKQLQSEYPLFAICMGHQLFALANRAKTHKMKFGHRGSNHPVKDLEKNRVYITSQNHGYTVDEDSIINSDVQVTQINLNDQTIEGLKHKKLNAFSVQYHPEANPGPQDTAFLFDHFLTLMNKG